MNASQNGRPRYPLRAVFGVAAAALFVLTQIGMLALWMMPLVPLVPLFVLIMLGNAFVLADVVQWAASLKRGETTSAVPERKMLESGRAAETFRDATERQAPTRAA